MRVPNSIILISSNSNHGAVKQQPAWYAKMYREVWGKRVDPKTGITVQPLPDETPESLRYSSYMSVAQAELETITYFAGGSPDAEGPMAQLFNKLFPNGLTEEINRLLEEDARRLLEKERRAANPAVAHPSFLAFHVSVPEALEFQAKGYATADALPRSLVLLSEVIQNSARAYTLLEDLQAADRGEREEVKTPAKAPAKAKAANPLAATPAMPRPPAPAGAAQTDA